MLKKKLTRNQVIIKYNKALQENLALAMENDELKKKAVEFENTLDGVIERLDRSPDSELKTELAEYIDGTGE